MALAFLFLMVHVRRSGGYRQLVLPSSDEP
jgi:hypothetical protein